VSPRAEVAVCLGFPPFHEEKYVARLRQLEGVRPLLLPVDPEGDWLNVAPGEPHAEPPPWARGVAQERRAALARAEVLVALHTPADLPALAPQLRWVQGIGAGIEQFAAAGVRRDSVIVTNGSGVSAGSMAEWVVGRLLQVWKRFRDADAEQRARAFTRTYGRTFAGSTIGIVGLGSIGCAVSQRVRAFGCRVLGLKRSAQPGDVSEHADALYPPEQLHEMLSACDAVVIAAPATPETRHLIDAAAIASMRRDAVLVNVARGSLVDEVALAKAMAEGSIAAAVLDVFDPEPLDPQSPFWDLPGVYVSAHSSVSIDRFMDDVFELVFDNLGRYVAGQPLRNVVDMQSLGFG
jgi:phosphoglycerate dehydrogenase-like enzyme